MRLKIIQVNIWKGKFLNELIRFLKDEKPDVITMQEVSAGAENNYERKDLDIFSYLQAELPLTGVFGLGQQLEGNPLAYDGNVVFVRGDIVSRETVWLKPFYPMSREEMGMDPYLSRALLDCGVVIDKKPLHIISIHGAWSKDPIDTPEKIRQAVVIRDHLKKLGDTPFVVGADMNMERGSQVIRTVEEGARNALQDTSSLTRSTHPTIHKTAAVKPGGLLVDFIFTSPHFSVVAIDAPLVAVSDHLPIRAILEFDI